MTSKKRKYGDLASQPVNSDPQIFADVFAAFTGKRPPGALGRERETPEPIIGRSEFGSPESRLPKFDSPKSGSPQSGLPENRVPDYQNGSLPESGSPKSFKDIPLDLMASLAPVEGYMKFWHQLTDQLYGQMAPAEQVVHLQLFRLSWGFNKPTCFISLPSLAKRAGVSRTTAQLAVQKLIKKGLVKKVLTKQGSNGEQGNEYYIIPPPSSLKSGSPESGSPDMRPIKEKALKENNKREMAPPDYHNCPDCQGSGFWYPEGLEKGVAKCKHQRLPEVKLKTE